MANLQLLLSPDESVALYVMWFLPTLNFCGGSNPVSLGSSLELSAGTGTCHVTFAYDWPGSVGILSISGGHVMLGAWISVEETGFLKLIYFLYSKGSSALEASLR